MALETEDFNPYQPPMSALEAPEPGAPEARVPWEDPDTFPSFWSRVGEMFSLAFSRPTELLARVPTGDSLSAPWRFVLLLTAPLVLLFGLLFLVMGAVLLPQFLKEMETPTGVPLGIGIAVVLGLVVGMPLFYFIQMVLWGLVNHASLWLWGGLRQGEPLLQTIRATGYGLAFFTLGSMIPLLNYLVMIAVPIVVGMGLARMHRTDTWRGVCALLTPVVLCCCLYAGFIAFALVRTSGT